MILDFSQNKINVVFEITEENTVALKDFSFGDSGMNSEKNLNGVQ